MFAKFFQNPMVRSSLQFFAKHAGSSTLFFISLFFVACIFSSKDELEAMLTAAPFLLMAVPGSVVLAMQTTYDVMGSDN